MKKDTTTVQTSIVYSARESQSCIPLIINALSEIVGQDIHWKELLEKARKGEAKIHVGIFIEPYLHLVLDGKKTLESRFSVNQTAPYGKVKNGDILLLKRSGGPIVGISQISEAWSYVLDKRHWEDIKQVHAQALCIQNPAFWEEKRKANYATLMRMRHVNPIEPPINFIKSDRRGWLVL
jgi:ASC-1-like (ASCH) protein